MNQPSFAARHPSRIARAAALAALFAIASAPLTAAAQTPTKAALDEASSRFKKGVDLYKEGDYRAALIEFRRAYELAPNYSVLYNMGQVQFQLQDYVGALSSLERYLSEGGSQVTAQRKAEVARDVDKLRARVAKLEIVTNVSDADIAIDDLPAGKSPLAKPLLVSAGRRKITISKAGFQSATKLVDVAGADSARVSIDLAESSAAVAPVPAPATGTEALPAVDMTNPPPPASTATPPPSTATEEPSSAPIVIGWTLTAGLTAGAVICGVLALGASSDLDAAREAPGQTRQGLDDAKSKTAGLALATDLLAAGAVVVGGISIYLTASGGSAEPPASVTVGLRPGGVAAFGTF